MAEIRLNRLAAEAGTPDGADRLVVIPSAAFTTEGDDAVRASAAADNPPETWTLETLRSYFQQGTTLGGASTFLALTDTPSSFGNAGQVLAVNSDTNALEFVDAATGGGGISDNLLSNPLIFRGVSAQNRVFSGSLDVRLTAGRWYIVDDSSAANYIFQMSAADGGTSTITTRSGDLPFNLSFRNPSDNTASPTQVRLSAPPDPHPVTSWRIDGVYEIGAGGSSSSGGTAETGASIVSKLSALTGADRLSYTSLKDTPTIPTLRTAGETAALLATLTGNDRLDASAIKNLPQPSDGGLSSVNSDGTLSGLGTTDSPLSVSNPYTAPTTASITELLRTFPALTTLANEDTLFAYDASSSQGVEITLQSLAGYMQDAIDIPDAEVDEFQFAVATISQGLGSNDAFANTPAGSSNIKDLSFQSTKDTASLGFSDASGRLSFGNTHTDRDTNLIITGRIPVQHSGLGGRLRVYFREFTSTQADVVNREVLVADHPITESASTRTFHFPITGTQVRVRRDRTYKVVMEFSATAGTAPNGLLSLLYTLTDNTNLIAFNRFELKITDLIDTPAAFGTAGQVLAVNNTVDGLEFVDAGGEQTATELFSTLREANDLTTLADADSVFGWDASSSQGVEMPLSTIKAFVNAGQSIGAENFLELTDTPSSFGSEGQILAVNEAGDGLVFNDPATGGTFPAVSALPAPTMLGMTAWLQALDPIYHQQPGLKRTASNPIEHRNRTLATIAADPIASNVYGASINPAGPWGHIDNPALVGQIAWSTAIPRYVNVALNVAITGTTRTELFIDFGSSEFGTDITRRLRFNRGSTSGNFTIGGRTYREWTVDTTEHDQSSDEVVQRLMELQDAAGDNDITIDVYTTATGDTELNFIPEFVWRDIESQADLKQKIEVPADQRLLLASEIFADNNVLKTYQTETALDADVNNLSGGELVRVRDRRPGFAGSSRLFVINAAVAGTDGNRGAANHRNRFSAQLLDMSHGAGQYWTANVLSLKRAFNNVQDVNNIDPDRRIGFLSFYNADAQTRPYIQVGIDPALTTANSVALAIMNRETSTGGNAPDLDVDAVRTGTTATFGGKSYNVYRYTLNETQATALGTAGWIFRDDIIIIDFALSHQRSESALNFNPDTPEFTAGTGYSPATDAVAADAQEVGTGGGSTETGASIVSKLQALTGNARLDAGSIRNLPQPADGGLAAVNSDDTLDGLGTPGSPLSVANPFTAADESKLDGIETNATADQTGPQIVALLAALTGNARLSYNALQDTPAAVSAETGASIVSKLEALASGSRLSYNFLDDQPSIPAAQVNADWDATSGVAEILNKPNLSSYLTAVGTDTTITGEGTTASPLSVANPFTAADESKLDGIESNATADQTGAEIVSLLTALSGNARLPATAIRDLPSGGGGASTFLALTDTPTSFGTAGQILAINSATNALEFVDAPSGGSTETGASIVSKLEALGGNARLDASAIKNLPQPQGGGLVSVNTDTTLSGLGTTASPLSVANPFTTADESKLDGIETGAQVNVGVEYTQAEKTKLDGIEDGAQVNVGVEYTQAEKTKLGDIATGAEVNVQADWNASSGDAFILNKPTIPAAETGATIVTKLQALTGGDRLDASAIKNLPQPQDGGIDSVETDSTLSGLGTTQSPLSVVNPFTDADETKLDGIETGAQVNVGVEYTQAEKTKLGGIDPNAEVNVQADWNATSGDAAILNKPQVITAAERSKLAGIAAGAQVNVAPTEAQIIAILRGATDISDPADEDSFLMRDASTSSGGEITYRNLADAVIADITFPSNEDDNIPFAYAEVIQSQGSNSAVPNTPAGGSNTQAIALGSTGDDASLGFNHSTGRMEFTNAHADRDATLAPNGRVGIIHNGLACTIRLLLTEHLSATPNDTSRQWVLAEHPIAAAGSATQFHLPITETHVGVRRGRTYQWQIEVSVADDAGAGNAEVSVVNTASDDKNRISFRRVSPVEMTQAGATSFAALTDTPSSLGSANQIPVVNEAGDALTFDGAFNILRGANNLASLNDADSVFGWDASSSQGAEITLATLKAFINEGQGDDSGGGSSTFLGLNDTPGAFGTAGQILAVNSATNALEFVDAPSGGSGGGIGDNLLSSPTGNLNPARANSYALDETLPIRLESDRFYAVVIRSASAEFSSPEVKTIRMQTSHQSGASYTAVGELTIAFGGTISNNAIPFFSAEFRNTASGNTQVWTAGEALPANYYRIDGIYEYASAGSGGASAFTALTDTPETLGAAGTIPAVNTAGDALEFIRNTFGEVDALPAPTALGMTAYLTALDPVYHEQPGLKRTIENPIEHRNRTVVDITSDPDNANIYGASLDASDAFGDIPDARAIGKIVWSTDVPRYCNIAISTALTGSTRTELYIDFGATEFSVDITRRIRFNRGTTSGNFTVGGVTYREWTIDTTEFDQTSDEVVARLLELQDESGDNKMTLDIYTAATGDTQLNHIPEFIWRDIEAQTELKQKIEVPADQRVLLASEIFADNNTLKTYQTEELLNSDVSNLQDGEVVRVRNTTPGSADEVSKIFVIDGGIAGTDGTKGAVEHRNRFSVQLLSMANGNGLYWTANVESLKRAFNNVQDPNNIDPDRRIGFLSFFTSGGDGDRPFIQVGIDPVLTTSNSVAIAIMNRETSTGGNAPDLDVDVVRTGTTANFGGKSYNVYRYTLNDAQATALGTRGWFFNDNTIIADFLLDHLRSGSVLNFNPDTVEFSTGTGYAAPTNPLVAAKRRLTPELFNVPITFSTIPLAVTTPHNETVFEYTVPATVATAIHDTLAVVHANFSVEVTTTESGADRTQGDFSLVHVRGSAETILERQTRYIRFRRSGQFVSAGFALDGKMNLRQGDIIRIVSRSQSETDSGEQLVLYTTNSPAYMSIMAF